MEGWGYTDVNGNSTSAWNTGKGNLSDQQIDSKLHFALKYPGKADKHWEGYSTLEPEYDPTLLKYIRDDIYGNNGYIWVHGVSGVSPNGLKQKDDARFAIKKDEDLLDYIERISAKYGGEYVLEGAAGSSEAVYVRGGVPYSMYGSDNRKNPNGLSVVDGGLDNNIWAQARFGSFDLPGGRTLLNEIGTEAIVTPFGTLTALPSHTGVVPADLTKNLFELGEIAPMIQKQLLGQVNNDMSHKVV